MATEGLKKSFPHTFCYLAIQEEIIHLNRFHYLEAQRAGIHYEDVAMTKIIHRKDTPANGQPTKEQNSQRGF